MNSSKKIRRLVELSVLVALVVVLQLISALIPPIGGTVSITLTLVPVVVGAILYGELGGAILGFAFGVIVLINCITGLDPGGNLLWNVNPFLTAFLCLLKGTAAGLIPAVLYKLIRGKNKDIGNGKKYVAALIAAISAPVVNTTIFVCGMLLFFSETLRAWAGETDVFLYILLGLAGVNFLVEFVINAVLTPAIDRIVDAVRKNNRG